MLRNDGGNANNSILVKTDRSEEQSQRHRRAGESRLGRSLTQIDEVRSGDSYISQSDLRLHFGLEQRTKVDVIQVRWPSGTVDKVTNVGANRIVTIKEGQGKIAEKEFKEVNHTWLL